ncbi:hypothetical protein COB57_00705 [Candidatus Peregrinibacteria bacterium]|nr:MAG: hypothetical protein COB57_00705 [Candidatus Peregrinibacteria bacterium]
MEQSFQSVGKMDLESQGRGEKITNTESVQKIKDLFARKVSRIEDEQLKKDIRDFLIRSALNTSSQKSLVDKYGASKFDIDGEKGLDKFEFNNFCDFLNNGINHIIHLKDFDTFLSVEKDIASDVESFSPQAYLRQVTGGRSVTDIAIGSTFDISPEESKKLLGARWKDDNFWSGVGFALAKEAPQMIEDVAMFLGDIAFLASTGGVVVAQYLYYRGRENLAWTDVSSYSYKMKVDAMGKEHPLFGLFNLIGSRGGDIVAQFWEKLKNPGEWTAEGLVVSITSIIGLVAGGAGAVRGSAKIAAKIGSKGGRIAKVLGKVEKRAAQVQRHASRADDFLNIPIAKAGEVIQKGVRKIKKITNSPRNRGVPVNNGPVRRPLETPNAHYVNGPPSRSPLETPNARHVNDVSSARMYERGDTVDFPRSDGSISRGKIEGWDEATGKYKIVFTENGQQFEKIVSPGKLDELNGRVQEIPDNIRNIDNRSAQEAHRVLQRIDANDVHRSAEVMAIGDLHGNINALWGNLYDLDLITPERLWKGGDRKVVFHGDILADRSTQGLEILENIKVLQRQAQEQGGDIIILAGNHDDFAISFLMDKPLAGGGHYTDIANNAALGIGEFQRYMRGGERIDNHAIGLNEFMTVDRAEIIHTMRNTAKGREMLGSLCDMKILERIDDTIFTHTDITSDMADMIISKGVDRMNEVYKDGLERVLLNGEDVRTLSPEFFEITDTFLATDNRSYMNAAQGEALREIGVNHIIHGHSADNSGSAVNIGGVIVTSVDHSAFKGRGRNDARSVGVIRTNGEIQVGVERTPITRGRRRAA